MESINIVLNDGRGVCLSAVIKYKRNEISVVHFVWKTKSSDDIYIDSELEKNCHFKFLFGIFDSN